jgi:hypothetical protein
MVCWHEWLEYLLCILDFRVCHQDFDRPSTKCRPSRQAFRVLVAAKWASRLEVQPVGKQNALPLMNGILLQKTLSLVTDGTAQEMKGVVNNGLATRRGQVNTWLLCSEAISSLK